ncbi:GNAT family N-acetyltransferase [Thioclava sp. IC9]|uniref:GNAT family N-acetyltransferase n=1 Tax=Thioclava sp. IC9 TaxID=1973007 RepID=UPI000B53F66F|nr:GNAT family N-acetyltransferase [Thioclava sp. IC9]OWX98813.1 GNAT family N-acetyltransferase [Thioclava sp. IC9]
MRPLAPLEVSGPRLKLRAVKSDDAGYIHALRTDSAYNAHLSAVTGTVEDQRRWIEDYKLREAEGAEYYYVAERLDDGRRCGVVRLYDIEDDHFTWGSWILDKNKPQKAALESAVLSFGIGFHALGKTMALIDVRHGNNHAAAFYRRLGMDELGRDDENFYFQYLRGRYEADLGQHLAVLEEQK